MYTILASVIKPIPCSPLLSTSLKMILDSGTTHHVSGNKSLFITYTSLPSLRLVLLGDGVTAIPISGVGTIVYFIYIHCIILHEVYYHPGIQDTLYSIKQHITYLNYYFYVEDNVMTLNYPPFTITAVTDDEVQVLLTPTPPNPILYLDSNPNLRNLHQPFNYLHDHHHSHPKPNIYTICQPIINHFFSNNLMSQVIPLIYPHRKLIPTHHYTSTIPRSSLNGIT